ncbi:protein ASPARTIC PROTEASE IN GUARD CELL 1-like [Coffea eugenioides]|uniref:protein ASPARTIC PROTEASE IN GUARD CELL 1-like n=1 Tax=Coffea eugenioides TaxID=49369 RepID=UPI000F613407|nr:protein ASPARTIC PROTEASE IN GUARD CELL 1-like [Coffea eugenioides]
MYMARKAQRPFPSVNIFIIVLSFFSFTLSPFSPQVVSASAFKRLQLFSTEEAQPSSTSSVLSLSLHPHSSIIKLPYDNYSDLVLSRLASDRARAKLINSNIERAVSTFNRRHAVKPDVQVQPEDLKTPLTHSEGGYLARIGVGRPVKEFHLIADTGSQITWLQCLPCDPCYEQSDPIFDPSGSSSFSSLSCASQECTSLGKNQNCKADPCTYKASYGDNFSSMGEFATETVSFGSSGSVDKVAIGCGHTNQGGFGGAAGILGLGGTPVGFPSQITATSFSYCLVDMDSNSFSSLEFNSAPPGDSVVVPLIINPRIEAYYYVELTGVTINGEKVSIPASDYQIGEDGRGGILVDSGTTITEFPTQVYYSVRDTFVKYARALPPASGFDYGPVKLDTCYDLSSEPTDGYPTMSFEFYGGKTLSLRPANYLIRVDASGKHCLAFTGSSERVSSERVSIIGNIQQQGMRVTYDLTNKVIGFSPNQYKQS